MGDLANMLMRLAHRHPQLREDAAPVVAGLRARSARSGALSALHEIAQKARRIGRSFMDEAAPSVPLGRLVDAALAELNNLFGPVRFSDRTLKTSRTSLSSALLGMQAVAADFEDGRLSERAAPREMAVHLDELGRALDRITALTKDPRYSYLTEG